MALVKKIEVDGKEVIFKASAAIPRIYRVKFGRDIYRDFDALAKAFETNEEEASRLDVFSLEVFENIAYIMAKHGDPSSVPDSIDDWLDGFEVFSIYEVLPQIMDLWSKNLQTDIQSKKKPGQPKGR